MLGVPLRLARLVRHGYYAVAAMDHGLSAGRMPGLATMDQIATGVRAVRSAGMRAVVLNLGLLTGPAAGALLPALDGLALVVQLYGSPGIDRYGGDRRPLGTVDAAISLGADAIALQLAPASPGFGRALDRAADLAGRARALGVPSLLMVNGSAWSGPEEFLDLVRAVAELPVDLVKANPGDCLTGLEPAALAGNPKPVLFAGGPLQATFAKQALIASQAGFAGVCLGRNIFQADDPAEAVRSVDRAFAASSAAGRPLGAPGA